MPSHFPDGLPAVLPATVAQITRRLPASGEIIARVGSRVEPDDLLGQATVAPPALFIDAAAALAIEPRDVPRRVKRKIGERVAAQQVLGKRGGRKCVAPTAGTISAIDAETGFVVLTPDPVSVTMSASVRGYVADVQPGKSALIETAAAVVQGMFGIGGEQFGVLRLLVTDRHDMITPDMIDARSAYALIIGGSGITAEALRKAEQEQVRGVIVGGIDEAEARAFVGGINRVSDWYAYGQRDQSAQPMTVLVTEGFGVHPMSEPVFELLTRYDRQEAFLEGATSFTPPIRRPRLVIPLPRLQGGQAPAAPRNLTVGAIVRLVDEGHLGQIGRVVALNDAGSSKGLLPSGLRVPSATVQISEAEQIVLPQTAIEAIG